MCFESFYFIFASSRGGRRIYKCFRGHGQCWCFLSIIFICDNRSTIDDIKSSSALTRTHNLLSHSPFRAIWILYVTRKCENAGNDESNIHYLLAERHMHVPIAHKKLQTLCFSSIPSVPIVQTSADETVDSGTAFWLKSAYESLGCAHFQIKIDSNAFRFGASVDTTTRPQSHFVLFQLFIGKRQRRRRLQSLIIRGWGNAVNGRFWNLHLSMSTMAISLINWIRCIVA